MAEKYLGEIRLFATESIPSGWMPCEGQLLEVQQNQTLYRLIGYTYGGGGRSFKLPDLRGRVVMGADNLGAAPRHTGNPGYAGGEEKVTLKAETMPSHTHPVAGYSKQGTSVTMEGGLLSMVTIPMSADGSLPAKVYIDRDEEFYVGTTVALHPESVSETGGKEGHDNMQPYVALNYCICVAGEYPHSS